MRVLAYASLPLRSSECVCVCMCVCKHMLMWLGLGPWDPTEDDSPEGALLGPTHWARQMGGERETEAGWRRQTETDGGRRPHSHTSYTFISPFGLHRCCRHYETSLCEYGVLFSSSWGSLITLVSHEFIIWENILLFIFILNWENFFILTFLLISTFQERLFGN